MDLLKKKCVILRPSHSRKTGDTDKTVSKATTFLFTNEEENNIIDIKRLVFWVFFMLNFHLYNYYYNMVHSGENATLDTFGFVKTVTICGQIIFIKQKRFTCFFSLIFIF